jgi:transcriptional regulator with XRE-family HTH domain
MENYNYKTLKSVREAQGLTQEQMAQRLNMTQPNYSKLENNHKKIISIEMWDRLAQALNITDVQIEALLTQSEIKLDADSLKIIESLQDQIKIRENFIESFINSAFHQYECKYEEDVPWEKFGEHEIEYVVNICGIKTKEEY